ncbi:hypothetical protein Tco_1042804 [Tanacetum coccineum]|uniref:Uncharacterized protein n=1 Tax=Tanacetum coccineum TaxID=301880 RepID=A0ABQ5GL75_9ASTR
MDDEPMWAADRVVAPTPDPSITILETANEFAIKGNHLTLVKGRRYIDVINEILEEDFDAFLDEGSQFGRERKKETQWLALDDDGDNVIGKLSLDSSNDADYLWTYVFVNDAYMLKQ